MQDATVPRRVDGSKQLFLISAVMLLIGIALSFRMTIDDAYISARYARKLSQGFGLVFNSGERLEGFSNPLLVGLMAAGIRIGIEPILLAKLGGVAATFGALVVARRALAPLPAIASLALVLFALLPQVVVWSIAGLETTLYSSLSMLALLVGGKDAAEGRRFAWPSFLVGLLWLLRPEGAMFLLPLLLTFSLLWYRSSSPKPSTLRAFGPLLRELALSTWPFVVVFALYQSFRYFYYGEWVPNTYFVKVGGSLASLFEGIRYIAAQLLSPAVLVLLGLAVIAIGRHFGKNGPVTALAVGMALQLAFIGWSGGDWMPVGRFMVPLLFLMLVPAGFGLRIVADRVAPLATTGRGRAALVTVATLVLGVQLFYFSRVWQRHYYRMANGLESRLALGAWLRSKTDGKLTVAYADAGALPYASDLPLVDLDGLVDREIGRILFESRRDCDKGRAACAAEADARITDVVLERRPQAVVLATGENPNGAWHPENHGKALLQNARFWSDYAHAGVLVAYAPGKARDFAQGRFLVLFLRKDVELRGLDAIQRCINRAMLAGEDPKALCQTI